MPLTIDTDAYAAQAAEKGKAFVLANLATPKLEGESPEISAGIDAFLNVNRRASLQQGRLVPLNNAFDFPYDRAEIRGWTKSVLAEAAASAPNPMPVGPKRNLTYLSGAYGSAALLKAAAQEGKSEAMQRLHAQLSNSMSSDFEKIKAGFCQHSGRSLAPFGVPPGDHYANWRGLLSGIDDTLAQIAGTHNINMAIDNSFAPANEQEKQAILASLKSPSDAKLHIFAMALTPQESAEAVKVQRSGATEAEAMRTAQNFCAFFPEMVAHANNVTLVDKNGQVLYERLKGQEKTNNIAALNAWREACRTQIAPEITAPQNVGWQR